MVDNTTSDFCLANGNIFFRDILDSMPGRIWVMDMTGNVVWQNLMARGQQTTVDWVHEIIDKDQLVKVATELESARHGHSGVVEFKRRLSDGNEMWVRAKYNPVYDSEGTQIGIYGFETDITAQKEAIPKLLKLKKERK